MYFTNYKNTTFDNFLYKILQFIDNNMQQCFINTYVTNYNCLIETQLNMTQYK